MKKHVCQASKEREKKKKKMIITNLFLSST